MQGWGNAPWLYREVSESWEINNPDWKIHYIDFNNLKDYVDDIDYIYDKSKDIKPAQSDIIRLSLLKNHGVYGLTLLSCMQPLDHWAQEAVSHSGIWMYHAHRPKTNYIGAPVGLYCQKNPPTLLINGKRGVTIIGIKKKNAYIFMDGFYF